MAIHLPRILRSALQGEFLARLCSRNDGLLAYQAPVLPGAVLWWIRHCPWHVAPFNSLDETRDGSRRPGANTAFPKATVEAVLGPPPTE